MSLTLTIILGSALGTFLGNSLVFWLIGAMAQRHSKAQEAHWRAEFEKQTEFIKEARRKETERLRKYAEMEG